MNYRVDIKVRDYPMQVKTAKLSAKVLISRGISCLKYLSKRIYQRWYEFEKDFLNRRRPP